MRIVLTLAVFVFVLFCGLLVVESGVFEARQTTKQTPCILLQNTPASSEQDAVPEGTSRGGHKTQDATQNPERDTQYPIPNTRYERQEVLSPTFTAESSPAKTVELGSLDPNGGFNFQLELTSKGAAISRATLSEFDDRDHENPQPFVLLSPLRLSGGQTVLSMANQAFVFTDHKIQLPLDKLNWETLPLETSNDGSQIVRFQAIIKDKATSQPVVKITKTYRVTPGSYHLDCDINVENLSGGEQDVRFNLTGPVGLTREGLRSDMRKAVAGFRDQKGQVVGTRLGYKELLKAKTADDRRLTMPGANFLWLAATNKYFAAILVPRPEQQKDFCDWVTDRTARLYNPDADDKARSGDEAIGVDLKIASATLASAGEQGSGKTYSLLIYLGPKDKGLFDSNELYSSLGFFQAIDFMPCCCCPAAVIYPLAFGILSLMKWMYSFIPNYGVVIIILVFLVRLALHPLTKKGQVSMSKMSKLAPKAQEIQKKYANNKTEMNRQMMALYKEQGASPFTGMLPMFVQMPIWIALYSAIYASIELRGAAFLPVWITDLSAPDALFRFATVTIPIVGWTIDSFNLLPILMGVAFYLQQKLMPSQAAASTNPQMAQQQKMMMIMLPLMFPLMLYKAPSGLNLYIMSSVSAGVVEQYFIRKHIRDKEQQESEGLVAVTSKTGGKVKKKKPKPFYKM